MALGPLNENERISSPTKGPPMIHKGIKAFMTNSQLRIYGRNVAQKTCLLKALRSAMYRKKFLSFPKLQRRIREGFAAFLTASCTESQTEDLSRPSTGRRPLLMTLIANSPRRTPGAVGGQLYPWQFRSPSIRDTSTTHRIIPAFETNRIGPPCAFTAHSSHNVYYVKMSRPKIRPHLQRSHSAIPRFAPPFRWHR